MATTSGLEMDLFDAPYQAQLEQLVVTMSAVSYVRLDNDGGEQVRVEVSEPPPFRL